MMIMPVMMVVITAAGGKMEAAQYVLDNVRDAHKILHGGKDGGPGGEGKAEKDE